MSGLAGEVRVRLVLKLTLAFMALALIPAGVVLSLTWLTVEERFEEEFSGRLETLTEGLREEVKQTGASLKDKVKNLVESEAVERVLVDMVRGSLDRRKLIPVGKDWMTARELDLLTMMDAEGVVLTSGHLRAKFGSKDQGSLDLAKKRQGQPVLMEVQLSREGRIRKALAVLLAETRRFNEAKIHMVGGVLIDDEFVAHLEKLSGARILIVDGQEKVVASSGKPTEWLGDSGMTLRRVPLADSPSDSLTANLIAGVSRNKLMAAQWRILLVSLLAAIASVVFSWLLGWLLSRRMVRPIEGLAAGARRVADGDLEHQVEPARGAEMSALVSTFNAMIQDLALTRSKLIRAERVAAWREIARRIAHEIKNPLSPIQMSIETMRKAYQKGHPEFAEIFEESTTAILEEVGALKRIVTEFSEFARLPKPSLTPSELRPIAEACVNLYRSQLPEGSTIELKYDADLPRANLDKEQISRVLGNLLSNALWAIGEGGQIVVHLGTEDDGPNFEVKDNGCGMDEEVLARVFTPYFTTRRGGTGLGLAITQRIVEDHGGHLEINSSPGKGTCVRVVLPALKKESAD